MVDVGDKGVTRRVATAQSVVWVPDSIAKHFVGNEIHTKKGPVFATAVIAGTMAAKSTSTLIPFCHPLAIEKCTLNISVDTKLPNNIVITSEVAVTGKTGVEMEALTACSVAALTVYDMCKAMSHEIQINDTRLTSKTGGKSDFSA